MQKWATLWFARCADLTDTKRQRTRNIAQTAGTSNLTGDVSEGYMYGPCEKWQDVERIAREEWQCGRHIVG